MIESSVVNGVFIPNRESCLEYLRKLRWPAGGDALIVGLQGHTGMDTQRKEQRSITA